LFLYVGNPHLADELTTESVDDAGDGRSLALADEVKIEHALHGSRLEATVPVVSVSFANFVQLLYWRVDSWSYLLDEASCLAVEESVLGRRT
jgi:hypothetical protein